MNSPAVDALLELGLDRVDGHLAHRPSERIPQRAPVRRRPPRARGSGPSRTSRPRARVICGACVLDAVRARSAPPAPRAPADRRRPPPAPDAGAASPRASGRPSLRASGAPRSARRRRRCCCAFARCVLNLLAARTRGLEVRRRVAADLRLPAARRARSRSPARSGARRAPSGRRPSRTAGSCRVPAAGARASRRAAARSR